MFIEKYTVQVKDIYSKQAKKHSVDANTPEEAHKKGLDYCNALSQDISKITDSQNNIVYTIANGFINE